MYIIQPERDFANHMRSLVTPFMNNNNNNIDSLSLSLHAIYIHD